MNNVFGKFAMGLYAVPNIPLIKEGDDLGNIIVTCCNADGFEIKDRDIVVVAQKIVSKAEGRIVDLSQVNPSEEAKRLSELTGRDARLCQVYIDESSDILDTKGRMVITRHRLGFECTGAGVDRSNISPHESGLVSLLPLDPDASARRIRKNIADLTGKDVAVIINDSFGKPDREGSIGISIGFNGIRYIEERNQKDLYNNSSRPWIALVDELSAAASIVMGQADEGIPVVVVRGTRYTRDETTGIKDLLINLQK